MNPAVNARPAASGTAKANALIAKEHWDQPLLAELSQVMRDASICGLGQAAPNPVDRVIKYFPNELSLKATSMSVTSPEVCAAVPAPTVTFMLDGREITACPAKP